MLGLLGFTLLLFACVCLAGGCNLFCAAIDLSEGERVMQALGVALALLFGAVSVFVFRLGMHLMTLEIAKIPLFSL